MIPKVVQKYLGKVGAKAEAISHRTVYTAYDLAKTTGVKLEHVAKSILIKVEPPYGEGKARHVIAVLPASHHLDLKKLKAALKVKRVSIPKEGVMAKLFRMKPGAMTPFGELHRKTPVIIDRALTNAKHIIARSGSFCDSLRMPRKDFLKATAGVLANFAKKVKMKR